MQQQLGLYELIIFCRFKYSAVNKIECQCKRSCSISIIKFCSVLERGGTVEIKIWLNKYEYIQQLYTNSVKLFIFYIIYILLVIKHNGPGPYSRKGTNFSPGLNLD